ncbi:MAG TPA: 16S rRNA (guanine(527)-N(7))-methyltransferase RsmG [Stellaceae bacterium]|nr:16S rRNA (guanine(527)-N(7))-methyltransferase RsmG [Stellaceae bacterium]
MRRAINDRPVRTPLGRDGFARVFPVSRETLERLDAFVALLRAWNRRINLVGGSTMGDPWRRHVLDSAQLAPHLPDKARILVDLGSGAGLPGLVLAVIGALEVHLVEADQKKAVFLREAARAMGTSVMVHAQRAEHLPPIVADVVTARAVAPLPELMDMAERFSRPQTRLLFLKGRTAEEELTLAGKTWKMAARLVPSLSDPGGMVLILDSVARERA